MAFFDVFSVFLNYVTMDDGSLSVCKQKTGQYLDVIKRPPVCVTFIQIIVKQIFITVNSREKKRVSQRF